MGREQGVTEEQLRAISAWRESEVFTDEECAVLAYSEAMTATPVDVTDEIFAAVRAHFPEDRQVVELTSALAWENYRARFDHALHIGAEGFSDGAYCPLPAADAV